MYQERIKERILSLQSVLCVGLDSVHGSLPESVAKSDTPQLDFNRRIIDATHDLVCCYKINFAFYAARGAGAIEEMRLSIGHARRLGVPVILDSKWGDIGHTAEAYAQAAFETFQADAVTVNPYMGEEAIAPFREYKDRGCYILCFTSNSSRKDFQTRLVESELDQSRQPLYLSVAEKTAKWNQYGNLGVVVGATAPEELAEVCGVLGEGASVLCPGVGAQGGDLEEVLFAGGARHGGLVINVSRAVIQASKEDDFAEAARREAQMLVDQSRAYFNQPIEDDHA